MTFVEAAVEVLRRTGRPLHFKKITEIAVRDALLSHTGKAPADTMALRLTQEVKSQGESIIVEMRPGVYFIKESALDDLNARAAERLEREKARRARRQQVAKAARSLEEEDSSSTSEEGAQASDEEEPKRRRRRRSSRAEASSESRSSRRRSSSRSSRRRGRSGTRGSKSEGSRRSTRSEARRERDGAKSRDGAESKETDNKSELKAKEKNGAVESAEPVEGRTGARRRARGVRRSRGADAAETQQAEQASSETAKSARSSSGSRSSHRRSRGGRQGSREERVAQRASLRANGRAAASASATRHLESGPVRLDGIAHAAYTVLGDADEQGLDIQRLADEIFDRKLVKFHTHDAAATVQAALANDNQIRSQRGHRPLFTRRGGGAWGLTEWALPTTCVQKEQRILSLSEEIRQDTVKHLADALVGVKNEALEHIALTLLERLGYQNIKVSKRSSDGDVYFTADWHQGLGEVRVCIQVTLEAEGELGEDAVADIRETLHHYSAAEGVIIHLGPISKAAVQQSREDAQAPITLIDRETFVTLLVRHGIGVQTYTTPILMVDAEFIELLKP